MISTKNFPYGMFGKLGKRHSRTGEDGIYIDSTRSACPECMKNLPDEIKLVEADIYVLDKKVYMRKYCPEHGFMTTLLSSDADWYFQAYELKNLRPGTPVLECQTQTEKGCPYDCGICPQHHQHMCAPIVDITDGCDMECPICSVRNTGSYYMTMEEWKKIVENTINAEGEVQILTLTGGEPSLHPRFIDFVKEAYSYKEITRVGMLTNGLKISKDENFCKELKENDVYVSLQFDGLRPEPYIIHRGMDLLEIKLRALENLKKYEINTDLQMCISKNNFDQVGPTILKYIREPFIRCVILQPLVLCGQGGDTYQEDPLDRITIPDIVQGIEDQTNGVLVKDDIKALPCAHAACQAVAYLYVGKKGKIKSMARMMNEATFLDLIKNEPIVRPEEAQKQSMPLLVDTYDSICEQSCAGKKAIPKEYRDKLEKRYKQIFLHHFMDAYNFDLSRVKRCCNFYALPDGKFIPVCYYNLYLRHRDKRWRKSFNLDK